MSSVGNFSETGINGPAWRNTGEKKASRHLDNTPSPVFCALNHLFKNHGCEKVVCSQFACQWIKRKTGELLI